MSDQASHSSRRFRGLQQRLPVGTPSSHRLAIPPSQRRWLTLRRLTCPLGDLFELHPSPQGTSHGEIPERNKNPINSATDKEPGRPEGVERC